MKRHRWILPVLSLSLAAGCGGKGEPSGRAADEKPVPVKAVRVAVQTAEEQVQYSATIEPAEKTDIAGKIMGKVERIRVSEGDRVRKGQLLVELQGEEIHAKLAQAQAGVVEANAHFENARKNLERFESLYEQKAATQKELDDVRVASESAQARLHAAQEMKREVEDLLQYVRIVAPFEGVVTKLHLDAGDLATPGRPIVSLENPRQIEIVASVPESQIENLSVGMPVKIVIPARSEVASEQVFTGSIDQIIPSADPGTHQFEIKAFIQNPSGSVMPGMFARIIVSRTLSDRLVVPRDAIRPRGQLEGIFVVGEDGRARLRWVRTGRTMGDQVEVLSGLEPGETVVRSSETRLRDGQRVEVTP